jgi:hypothetical protein
MWFPRPQKSTSNIDWPKFIALCLVLALILLLTVALTEYYKNKEKIAKETAEVASDCSVIGDVLDSAHGGAVELRKIYKCPDGLIRIR